MPTLHSWLGCHDVCVVDIVSELMDKGYTCYLEYEILFPNATKKHKQRAVVDVYAVKQEKEVIVEVGTLSPQHGDRIKQLKELMPKAKILWIHQWKNYFSVYDSDREYKAWLTKRWAWKYDRELYEKIIQGEINADLAFCIAMTKIETVKQL